MIRVVAIYPAFDVQMNEMALVWRQLCARYPVHCTVLTVRRDIMKGNSSQAAESCCNLEIRRFASHSLVRQEAINIAREAKPDLIFCAVSHNMPAALTLQKATGAPIMLHSEYFLDDCLLLARRYHLGLGAVRACCCTLYRAWLAQHTIRILSSNPAEFRAPSRYRALRYLAWPHPSNASVGSGGRRDLTLGAYVGSSSLAKGAATLAEYVTALLRTWPAMRFSIVGQPLDRTGRKALAAIQRAGGSRVSVVEHCSRDEALQLIRRSLFVFSPGRRLGWGLIGDAWASGTPVLACAEHYDLQDGYNCWVVRSGSDLSAAVAMLQGQEDIREQLARGGRLTVTAGHTVEATCEALYAQLVEVGSA